MDELPDDLKEIVRQCGIDAAAYQTEQTIQDDAKGIEALTEHGVQCYVPTDEELKTFTDYADSISGEIRDFIGAETYDKAFEIVEAYRASH